MAERRRPSHDATLAESTIRDELIAAGDRLSVSSQSEKKNYAEVLSRRLAQRFADLLRPSFSGILPDTTGGGHESRVRSSKGYKKLDVNYSTPELGLGLGISIKTLNFPDGTSRRYTKNYTRIDAELRAEASDYHERQPYAVMIAVIFLPADACADGNKTGPSSFGAAVRLFRQRAGRVSPAEAAMLFEQVFIGLYDPSEANFGHVGFFDMNDPPPKKGPPGKLMTLSELAKAITDTYDDRNAPKFQWADAPEEEITSPPTDGDPDD